MRRTSGSGLPLAKRQETMRARLHSEGGDWLNRKSDGAERRVRGLGWYRRGVLNASGRT